MSKLKFSMQKVYAAGLSLLMALPLVSVSAPAFAAAVACGTAGTPAVTFLSDPTFTMSTSDSYDANYIGYKVTPSANVKDMWVGLSNFTGGVITLAPSQTAYQANGETAVGVSKVNYFLAKGATATTTAQSHTVTVYEGNPNAGTATALCTATNTFTRVEDTITANSNKVNTITVSSATGTLGATVDITVQGDTGTIGAGPAYDVGVINLAPAVKSNFPANAWRLKKVVYTDTTNSRTFTDVLHLTGEDTAVKAAYAYTAVYSFVAIGTTDTAATLLPIQYIASGTQIKHTGATPTTLPTIPAVTNSLTMTKTANVTQVPYLGGDVEYTVTINNAGAATTVDQVVDRIPTGSTYKAGSSFKAGVATTDPTLVNGILTYVGPHSVPANSSLAFKYKLTYGASTGNYSNSAVAYVNSTQVDRTLDTQDNAPATSSIFVLPYPPNVQPGASTATGPGSSTFTPVNTQSGSTIDPTLTCIIDPSDNVCKKTFTDGKGTWKVETNGDITFTPKPTYTGEATVTYVVSDSYAQKDQDTLTVDITLPPKPSVTAVTKSIYGWNPDTTPVSYSGVGITANTACFIVDNTCVKEYRAAGEGLWTIGADGQVTFDPDFGYRGTTTPVSYRITDQYSQTGSNTVTYIVTAPEAPIATPLTGTTNFDTNIQYIPSTSNSIETVKSSLCIVDPADTLCKTTVTISGQGTYTVNTTTGTVTFNPDRGFTGSVTTVTYKMSDIYGQETSSTINTTVREPLAPTLSDKHLTTPYNTPVNGNMTATPGDGTISTYCIVSGADCVKELIVDGEGTWTVTDAGKLTFTPVRYFSGNATDITVKITDEWNKTATAKGSATVGIPNAPVGDSKTGVALWHSSVTIRPTVTGEKIDWTTFCIVDPADSVCKKSFTIAGTGSFTVDPVTGETTFMPAATFTGLVPAITYQVKDGWNQTATNVLNFSAGLPTAPSVAPVSETTPYNTPITFTPVVTSEAAMDSKFCIIDGSNCVTNKAITEGTFTVDANTGEVVFTPAAHFAGTVPQQAYRVENIFGQRATNTIDITVSKPAAPTASPLTDSVGYRETSTQTPSATGTDVDYSTVCIVSGTDCVKELVVAGEGTWTVDANNKIVFTPERLFYGQATQQTYRVTDAYNQSASATVDVLVATPPASPTVSPLSGVTPFDTNIKLSPEVTNLATIDPAKTCIISGTDCVSTLTVPGEGTWTVDANGDITFNPERGFTGQATQQTYRVEDEYGFTGSNTMNVTVEEPVSPTVNDESLTTPYNTPTTVDLTTVKGDGEITDFCIVSGETCVTEKTVEGEGTWTVTPEGKLTFTPEKGFTGNVTPVEVKITDEFGRTDTATINVEVTKPTLFDVAPLTDSVPFNTPAYVVPSWTGEKVSTLSTCIIDPADDICKTTVTVEGEGTYTVDHALNQIKFTPAYGFSGQTTQVTYRMTDAWERTDTDTINITVTPSVAPTITDDSKTTPYLTPVVLTPTVTKGDGEITNTCFVTGNDCVTTLTIDGEGTYTILDSEIKFTPVAGFTGDATPATVKITDEFNKIATGVLNVNVELPAPPTADHASKITLWNTPATVEPAITGTDINWSTFCIIDPADDVCKTEFTTVEGSYKLDQTTHQITFTPAPTFNGTAPHVHYRITDGFGQTATNTVQFSVGMPTAPTAEPIVKTTPYNTPVKAMPVLVSETDLDVSETCIISGTDCVKELTITEGTFTVDSITGEITFTPADGFAGVAPPQTYRGEDTFGQFVTSTIDVTVEKPAAPTASPLATTTLYVTPVSQAPSATGTNLDYSTVCIVSGTECVKELTVPEGVYKVDVNNQIVFTPADKFYGTATQIQYRITDAYSQSATSTVDVTVTEPYIAPEALPLTSTTPWNTATTVTSATKNNTPFVKSTTCLMDVEDCVATLTVTGEGTYVVNTTTGEITFTPERGFFGTATQQTYRIADEFNRESTSTVDIIVSDPVSSTINDESLTTPYNTPKTVDLTINKGDGNITDVCFTSGTECVTELTVDGEGTWTVTPEGKLTFTPVDGFTGDATPVEVKITDEFGRTDTADVTINVELPQPLTVDPLAETTNFNTPAYVTPSWTGAKVSTLSTCIIDPNDDVCKTTVVVEGEGTYTVNHVLNQIKFKPVHGFSGQTTRVNYRMSDAWERTAENTIDINIGEPKQPAVNNVHKTTPYKTPVTAQPTYTEGDGQLTNKCILVEDICVTNLQVNGEGTWNIDSSTGDVTFTPEDGFTGDATPLTVQAIDEFGITATGMVTVMVSLPEAPTADPATKITLWNTPASIEPVVTGTDIDWSTFCVIDPADSICKTSFTIEGEGTYTVDVTNHTVTFTPAPTFHGSATELTYQVSDIFGQTATSTVQFSVGMPDAPTVNPIVKTTPYNTPVSETPVATTPASMDASLTCIVDGEDCVTTKTITEGTFTVNTTTGEITFTPADKFYGTVPQQTFKVTDTFNQSVTNTIDVTVDNPTPPTIAPEDKKTTPYNTPKVIDLTINKGDGDISKVCITSGDTCVTEKTVEGEGTWTVTPDGKLTFTPEEGFTGDTTPVEVVVEDEFGNKDQTNVEITVEMPAVPTVDMLSEATPWNASTNVTPSFHGEKIDASITCIIDPSDSVCKDEVTVAGEGTYTYSKYTGLITFMPVSGFAGNATPVTYQMGDIWGRTATNTIYITVTMPTPPAAGGHNQTVPYNGSGSFTLNTSHTAPLDKICLLDNGACVNTLTVNGGTYTINPNTGAVEFTTATGYTGPVQEVSYRIYDTFGQYAENNININVDSGPLNPEYSEISGIIWVDLNHNNVKDNNEPLLPNIPVTLSEDGNVLPQGGVTAAIAMNVVNSITTNAGTYTVYTDSQGHYSFTVTPGAYVLTAQITSDKIDPSWDSTGNMDWTVPVILAANEQAVANFATAGTGSMQGKVVFENKEVIPNAQVMCTWEGMDGILPSDDDVTFYFQTDADGNFLAEGIPGGQFVCEGKDPTSNKTSSPVEVAVDKTAPEPATAELVLPLEETPAPTPEPQLAAEKTQPLAYTGTNLQTPTTLAVTLLVLGFIMVGYTAFTKRKRENETEEN